MTHVSGKDHRGSRDFPGRLGLFSGPLAEVPMLVHSQNVWFGCFDLYEFHVNNTSDFYLVKLWRGTMSMTQYIRSEKFNLRKDCPKCRVLGSQQHLLDTCEINSELRRNLKAHPLVVKDESLYKQIHGCRTNSRKLKRGDYDTLVGLFGRFVEDTWMNFRKYLAEHC